MNLDDLRGIMNGRRHSRVKLERVCYLIGKDGEYYSASLVDISFSGALVNVVTGTHFRMGDSCNLMVNLKSDKQPIKRTCEIVRLDGKIVGVKFLT